VKIQPSEILDFWFEGDPSRRRGHWFEKNAGFDSRCARFIAAIRHARDGGLDQWAVTPLGALALIVLLDQVSRNVFRGSAEAFAADSHAHEIACRTIAERWDTALTPVERMFVYLPFQHAETMADQDESVRLFETLRDDLGAEVLDYAYGHRDVIRKFGRFPHRNAALGRINTPEEDIYLAQDGAGHQGDVMQKDAAVSGPPKVPA
jgi:uncharacterized protein (DUF924 family)